MFVCFTTATTVTNVTSVPDIFFQEQLVEDGSHPASLSSPGCERLGDRVWGQEGNIHSKTTGTVYLFKESGELNYID